MKIKDLQKRPNIEQHKKLMSAYAQLDKLLSALRKKELPEEIVSFVNHEIVRINSASNSRKEMHKQIRQTQSDILKKVERDLHLVTKHHYRNKWLALGMAVFGIPLGVAFGASLGNMAFLAIGIPVGMGIGIALGTSKDKKALEEGRQINFEI